jgi:hypothetical protein
MAKTKTVYVTVGELRKWLDGGSTYGVSFPDDWVLVRTEYGFAAYHPDVYPDARHLCGEGFSLVPEDEEE